MWIVSVDKKDSRKLTMYPVDYFPRSFYYKRDAKLLVHALHIQLGITSIISKKELSINRISRKSG